MTETQLMPQEIQAKTLAATTKNLPNNDVLAEQEFNKRVKIAELMLKEKDIENKLKVVELQNFDKSKQKTTDNEFLKSIIGQ
tara:strand:- start:565 stop:810 length:246 start_codon:yes stop_codon:yes gene_type:complete